MDTGLRQNVRAERKWKLRAWTEHVRGVLWSSQSWNGGECGLGARSHLDGASVGGGVA